MNDAPETIWIDDERSIGGSANILYAEPPYDDPYIREYRLTDLPAPDLLDDPRVKALVKALEQCRDELDAYSQNQYPSDHPVHIAYRKRDYDANPARAEAAEAMLPRAYRAGVEGITEKQQVFNYKAVCLFLYGATVERLTDLEKAWNDLEKYRALPTPTIEQLKEMLKENEG